MKINSQFQLLSEKVQLIQCKIEVKNEI